MLIIDISTGDTATMKERTSNTKWLSRGQETVDRAIEGLEEDSLRRRTPPFLVQTGPILGVGALLLALTGTLANFAVLKASDGDPTASWTYQPTVYLAILTAVSNKALAFAMIQGCIVTWWEKLHREERL